MRRPFLIIIGILAVVLIGAGIWFLRPDVARLPLDQVVGRVPQLPDPRDQMIPTVRVAPATGWPDGAMPQAAAGLKVEAYADKLDHPRWLYRLPNGDMLVAETAAPPPVKGTGSTGITAWVEGYLMKRAGAAVPSANRITLLRDTNGDGKVDGRSVLIGSGLNSPFGMALVGDWLYVANNDSLVRYPYKAGQTKIDAKPEKIIDLPAGGNHWTRSLVAAPDGKTLYVGVGSTSNIAENGIDRETNRAAILEVDPAARTFRIYAAGLRNPVGVAFEPKTKSLWAVVNERDMMGSDTPPDYLTQVSFGGFYGWPYNYWGGYEDLRVKPRRQDLREYTTRPDYALGPHVAALGLSFADGEALGDKFANGAFVGLHGSWNRVPVSGYKVVFVPFGDNGLPVKGAAPVDVLTGFLDAQGNARGRPVGVQLDRTGALLVADDVGNRIWRVSRAQ